MGKHVHASVASPKERAQDPADDADDNRAPECAGKSLNVEPDHDAWHEEEHQAVYDENE